MEYLTTKHTKSTKPPQIILTKENEPDVSRIAVDAAYKVHKTLGSGLLESAYEECLFYELVKRNLKVERQMLLPIIYDDLKVDAGYRLDLIIEDELVVELKSVEKLLPVHTGSTSDVFKAFLD